MTIADKLLEFVAGKKQEALRWYTDYRPWPSRNKYKPHNGDREMARRVRQMANKTHGL